jgi:hypothetical protein
MLTNMPASFKEIEQQAIALPEQDRAALAEALLETLHSCHAGVEAAWAREIDSRVAALDRAELHSFAAEEIFVEAHGLFR